MEGPHVLTTTQTAETARPIARLSTPVFALPTVTKLAAGLSGTDAMSGGVIFEAVVES